MRALVCASLCSCVHTLRFDIGLLVNLLTFYIVVCICQNCSEREAKKKSIGTFFYWNEMRDDVGDTVVKSNLSTLQMRGEREKEEK